MIGAALLRVSALCRSSTLHIFVHTATVASMRLQMGNREDASRYRRPEPVDIRIASIQR
jgi:hypothetical protein